VVGLAIFQESFMSAALVWIIVGILLIVSELLATSIVAVFIGIGAIVTGVLLQMGVIESVPMQLLTFSIATVASLVLARKKLQTWFKGSTTNRNTGQSTFQQSLGDRVTVKQDFDQGGGRVILNGVAWDALSDDDLREGEVAWVIANEGIHLTVSRHKTQTSAGAEQ
jgi:membrane protein implicated in regulation of membrane protease activity